VDGYCCDTACGNGNANDAFACNLAGHEGTYTQFANCCPDADSDGYCAAAGCTVTTNFICPVGYYYFTPPQVGNDCNDGNGGVHPGATEVCNGIDDNCVGGIDEGGNSLCDDGIFCNGVDTCQSGACAHAGSPCQAGERCDEPTDTCEGSTNIDLVSFTAIGGQGEIRLAWETATEADNAGFHLLRGDSEAGTYSRITAALIPSEGSPTGGATYAFTDDGLTAGQTYWYKLEDVDIHGNSTFHGPVNAKVLREPLIGCGMANGADGSLAGLLVLVGMVIARRATRRR
jgi:hypothetical protein